MILFLHDINRVRKHNHSWIHLRFGWSQPEMTQERYCEGNHGISIKATYLSEGEGALAVEASVDVAYLLFVRNQLR